VTSQPSERAPDVTPLSPPQAQLPPYPVSQSTGERQESAEPSLLGSAALLVGVVAVVVSFIPYLGLVSLILGPVAIFFGVIGTTNPMRRTKARAGWIMGVVAIVVSFLWIVLLSFPAMD
jgi:hypothetical protein